MQNPRSAAVCWQQKGATSSQLEQTQLDKKHQNNYSKVKLRATKHGGQFQFHWVTQKLDKNVTKITGKSTNDWR